MAMWEALGIGVSLGLGAGITPGPLLGLVINETLRNGSRAGVLVSLAPPLADILVIVASLLLLGQLPAVVFPLLSLGGGAYVIFLGWETLHPSPQDLIPRAESVGRPLASLRKGIMVNLLNPHPWLFWFTVGGPLVMQRYREAEMGAIIAFLGGFYGCLVGSKIILALLIQRGRARLQDWRYPLVVRTSGVLLLVFGGLLVWEGVRDL